MCQAFDGTVTWVSPDDASDPAFGIKCTRVTYPAGGLSKTGLTTLFKLLRDFLEHFP